MGPASGPGPVGPGTGDKVSTNVTYQPVVQRCGLHGLRHPGGAGHGRDGHPGAHRYVGARHGDRAAGDDADATSRWLRHQHARDHDLLERGHHPPGSTPIIVDDDDFTLNGPGTLDGLTGGFNSAFPAILVKAGADNFILNGVEIKRWEDGVQVEGSVESLKLVGNWIHDNTDAGLQVDSGATVSGIVTIEGNLFKANGGTGVRNGGASLKAQYNSWGRPGVADVVGTVDAANPTYAELYLDVDPTAAGDQYVRDVNETNSFTVTLMAQAQKLYGLTFKYRTPRPS